MRSHARLPVEGRHGWRYANVHEGTCDGDIVLVTENGWLDFMTKAATRPSA